MDEKIEKPCWNVTAWALTTFVVILFIIAILSGSGSEVAATDSLQPIS